VVGLSLVKSINEVLERRRALRVESQRFMERWVELKRRMLMEIIERARLRKRYNPTFPKRKGNVEGE